MKDAGCRIQDAGYQVLDAGYKKPNFTGESPERDSQSFIDETVIQRQIPVVRRACLCRQAGPADHHTKIRAETRLRKNPNT